MRREHSWVYLVAFAAWLVGWVAVLLLPEKQAAASGLAVLTVAASNWTIGGLAWVRVHRGDAWTESPGTLGLVLAEFLLMQLGIRLPAAVAALRAADV